MADRAAAPAQPRTDSSSCQWSNPAAPGAGSGRETFGHDRLAVPLPRWPRRRTPAAGHRPRRPRRAPAGPSTFAVRGPAPRRGPGGRGRVHPARSDAVTSSGRCRTGAPRSASSRLRARANGPPAPVTAVTVPRPGGGGRPRSAGGRASGFQGGPGQLVEGLHERLDLRGRQLVAHPAGSQRPQRGVGRRGAGGVAALHRAQGEGGRPGVPRGLPGKSRAGHRRLEAPAYRPRGPTAAEQVAFGLQVLPAGPGADRHLRTAVLDEGHHRQRGAAGTGPVVGRGRSSEQSRTAQAVTGVAGDARQPGVLDGVGHGDAQARPGRLQVTVHQDVVGPTGAVTRGEGAVARGDPDGQHERDARCVLVERLGPAGAGQRRGAYRGPVARVPIGVEGDRVVRSGCGRRRGVLEEPVGQQDVVLEHQMVRSAGIRRGPGRGGGPQRGGRPQRLRVQYDPEPPVRVEAGQPLRFHPARGMRHHGTAEPGHSAHLGPSVRVSPVVLNAVESRR